MKVALLSLGCKVNQSEFMEIESLLRDRGAEIVSLDERPDFCLINTCSVTAKSDYQSRQLIRRAAQAGAKVIVTGCYSELNPEPVRKMKGVFQLIENSKKESIINMLGDNTSSLLVNPWGNSFKRSRFLVKIQDGCNYSCSYCLIPAARGRARSIAPQEVISRVKEAVSRGYMEAVLTGIHIGLYGVDLVPKMSITDLIAEILEKTAIYRLRISSLEVNELDERLLDLMKAGRLCPHLHIPLQSGDDRILALMKRPYKVKEFKEKVLFFSDQVPCLGLGTDVIPGFPGEGEEEFENTAALLSELPLTYMHIFPYSERPGTRASLMPDKVPPQVRKARAAYLRKLSEEKKSAFLMGLQGREEDLLIEEIRPEGALGTTGNFVKALARVPEIVSKGNIIRIRFEGHESGITLAKPLN